MSWLKTPWSIRGALRREEREWARTNKIRRQNRPARIEKELLFAGERPFRFALSLLLLHGVLLCLADRVPSEWLTPLWTKWSTEEHLAYFSTVWGVQTTLVALVYPIVIAFVAVFLQRRPTSETFIGIYLLDSGGLAAGLSSLALVLVMTVQYLLQTTRGVDVLAAWTALNTAWLILNAALTAFFLYRTVEFLRPEVQARVIRRYLVNVALPREVARLNGFQVFAASMRGLPVHLYGEGEPGEKPRLLLGTTSFREGVVQARKRVSQPSLVVNMRLWLVRLVVLSWSWRARRHPRPEAKTPFGRESNWPLLVLPIKPAVVFNESLTLARVADGPSLMGWEKWLLRWAVTIRPESWQRPGILVESVLNEMSQEARQAAESGDSDRFENAYVVLVDTHRLLLGASLTPDVQGKESSWALLPDISRFFNRSLHEKWAEAYRAPFEAAVENLAANAKPLLRLCHLLTHLRGDELDRSPVEVRVHLLQFHPVLMYLLSKWWARRAGEQGFRSTGPNVKVHLMAPLQGQYDEVLAAFVDGWENGRPDLPSRRRDGDDLNWAVAHQRAQLSVIHLEESARLLLSAVYRGDQAAAEWFADVLSKWWDRLDYDVEPFQLYRKSDFITLDHLSLSWDAFSESFGLRADEMPRVRTGELELQKAVYRAALRNFWTDVRLLVVELLVDWGRRSSEELFEESLALDIASGLLAGRQWREGGGLADSLEALSPTDYLTAKVRQFAASGEWRGGYVGRLDSFVERSKRMERPDMVSSRIYSFGGADNVESLQESQIYLLAVLTSQAWSMPPAFGEQVNLWMRAQYNSIGILLHRLESWLKRLNELSESAPPVVNFLRSRSRPASDSAANWDVLSEALQKVKTDIDTARSDVFAAEPIDPERLTSIAHSASSKGFDKKTAEFPVHLFKIGQSKETLEPYTLTLQNVGKGELTRVEMDQRAINEDESYAEMISQHVAWVVLSDVLRQCQIEPLIVTEAEAYWLALQHHSAEIVSRGDTPVLLLDNATRPEWMWDWQHEDYESKYPRPAGLRVQRREGHGHGYICHFNDIVVYTAPLPYGESLLMPRSAFERVDFTEFSPNCFVNPAVTPRAESKSLVDINLTFSRRVKSNGSSIHRLVYQEANQN